MRGTSHQDMAIRSARPDEASALTELCIRSKAHWGYDAEFMRLSAAALAVPETVIDAGRVVVAETSTGRLLGVAAVAPLPEPRRFDLLLMFVEPGAIRTGVGRALFTAAVEIIAGEGGDRLEILADPFAEAFYRRLGAVRIGDAPSNAIPGRRLPLLEYTIREGEARLRRGAHLVGGEQRQ
jgi:GNAT superfamily N-acetyltransferase